MEIREEEKREIIDSLLEEARRRKYINEIKLRAYKRNKEQNAVQIKIYKEDIDEAQNLIDICLEEIKNFVNETQIDGIRGRNLK